MQYFVVFNCCISGIRTKLILFNILLFIILKIFFVNLCFIDIGSIFRFILLYKSWMVWIVLSTWLWKCYQTHMCIFWSANQPFYNVYYPRILFLHYQCYHSLFRPLWLVWHEMYCHDLEVMSSSPDRAELGMRGTSDLSCTWTKHLWVHPRWVHA